MSNPETMMIDDVTYIRADSVPAPINLPAGEFAPWEIGEAYFIQTVTHYYLGKLVDVKETELVITNASWVASTGRFNQFMSGSNPSENEPYPQSSLIIIGRGALISAVKRKIFIEVA